MSDISPPGEGTTKAGTAVAQPGDASDTWIGDWLLTFGTDDAVLPARQSAAPWLPGQREGAAFLRQAAACDRWRGLPLSILQLPDWTAWLSGELYGVARSAGVATAVTGLLEGRASAAALSGHFLLLARHKPSNEWHIWTDRHATLHAYLAANGSRRAVGTFAPAVAAAAGCTELDWEGLTSFFGFGFFGGDRTHFKVVHTLRPATHYRLDDDGRLLSGERYWHWHHTPDTSRSYDETLEAFADCFVEVMNDLTAAGRIALPISGGLDSRSTVATIAPDSPAHARLWAYSYGYSDDSVETRIAKEVAAARGLAFDAFTIGPYLFDRLPDIIAAAEGFQDVTQARQSAVSGEIAAHAAYLIAAHWGDVFLDDMGVDPSTVPDGGLVDVAVGKFHKTGSDWLLEHLCRPHSRVAPQQFLRDMTSAELERAGAVTDPDFTIKILKTEQWSARWTTASLRMFQAAAFPRLPFYDARLVDFFCTVPTSFVAGRRLQIDYLKRYASDLARVPWQVTGRDLYRNGEDSAADVARRAVRKGWRVLRRRKVIERNWEVQFLGAAGRAGLERWLLRPGLALHEFVAPRDVRTLLDAFARDPYAEKRGYTVSMLLTFSAWLEQYGRGVTG